MAQRTYWDAFGYKKKKRKRGTKQYGTIREMEEDIAAKKIASAKENPAMNYGTKLPKDKGLSALQRIQDDLISLDPLSGEEDASV